MLRFHRLAILLLALFPSIAFARPDPYERYLATSKDFEPVRQDPQMLHEAWPGFIYMPWTYQWHIGYSDASGKWSLEHGYNGAFLDHGQGGDKLKWIDRHGLRFYMDHTASKGYLHLWDGNAMKPHADKVHGTGVRIKPVNAAMKQTLQNFIKRYIENVKSSPNRAAYALDDEISWGHFVHPTMWCVTDDKAAYAQWLNEVYGPEHAPKRDKWISYNDILPRLKTWTLADFDASPLMDQWTFNDAYWGNFIGELVTYANSIDPATPCGFVGGQAPNAFGGYDYARLMRKVQFIESYNIAGSQAIIRSFNPQNTIPAVTTHFHKNVDDTIWQAWYYLAHGNRGFIGWVENWFDKTPAGDLPATPKPWHGQVAPALKEVEKLHALIAGARWQHDGIGLYYSHPSIQLSWILDAQCHGKTWINRNNDDRLGSSHQVRKAWENMLRDEGLQYNFISYVDIVREEKTGKSPLGTGEGTKGNAESSALAAGSSSQSAIRNPQSAITTLILPAVLALSDAEAKRIRQFVENGGTLIADYLPGLWDQHGKGRPAGGALDDVFGVKHVSTLGAKDLFNGTGQLWVETDQDANYSYKSYEQFLTNKNSCIKDISGFNRAVRDMPVATAHPFGKGKAILMNLSPQWYNAYRAAGAQNATKREVFLRHVPAKPVVRVTSPDNAHFGCDITRWRDAVTGQTVLFITLNPELSVSSTGGGNASGLRNQTVPLTLTFARPFKNARDERAGKDLGDTARVQVNWKMNEAIVISYQ